jgi:hypothetical protein
MQVSFTHRSYVNFSLAPSKSLKVRRLSPKEQQLLILPGDLSTNLINREKGTGVPSLNTGGLASTR